MNRAERFAAVADGLARFGDTAPKEVEWDFAEAGNMLAAAVIVRDFLNCDLGTAVQVAKELKRRQALKR